jgi:hypothetical protein
MKLRILILIAITTLTIGSGICHNSDNILNPGHYNLTTDNSVKTRKQFTELRPDEESSPLRLSKEQLGRFSWYIITYSRAILHSMAAAFPQNPTEDDKKGFTDFLNLL